MGVRIYKEKRVEHLLPGEKANFWPAWRMAAGITDKKLDDIRAAYNNWLDHRTIVKCQGCKKGRDGGIYVCDKIDSRDVQLGWIEHILYLARTTVESVFELSFLTSKVGIRTAELADEILVFPKETIVTTDQLYDPDKDSKVQPPKHHVKFLKDFPLAG